MRRWTTLGMLFALFGLGARGQQASMLASGLKNPSKVILAGGSLMVTEVDSGPNTGRVSVVNLSGRVQALIEGLPSGGAAPDGTLDGPNGLALSGRVLYVANGEGDSHVAGPTPGTIVPNPAGKSSPIFSSILKVTFSADPGTILSAFTLSRADQELWPTAMR